MTATAIRQRYVIPWTTIDANTNLLVNQGYHVDAAGNINLTLPPAPAQGAVIAVTNVAGDFTLLFAGSAQVRVANLISSVGVAGSVASNDVGDSLYLVYEDDNDLWVAISSVGTITVL